MVHCIAIKIKKSSTCLPILLPRPLFQESNHRPQKSHYAKRDFLFTGMLEKVWKRENSQKPVTILPSLKDYEEVGLGDTLLKHLYRQSLRPPPRSSYSFDTLISYISKHYMNRDCSQFCHNEIKLDLEFGSHSINPSCSTKITHS